LKTKHCGNFGTAPSSTYLHLKMGHEASKYYDFIVHVILELQEFMIPFFWDIMLYHRVTGPRHFEGT
jgi:hypothetical protein